MLQSYVGVLVSNSIYNMTLIMSFCWSLLEMKYLPPSITEAWKSIFIYRQILVVNLLGER